MGGFTVKVVNLIKYDLREGYRQAGAKLIGIVFITLFSCIEFYIEKGNYNAHYAEIIDHATCADYLCFLLEGMHPFRPKVETTFVIPIRWLLIHLFLLYAVLYYPYRDLVQSIGSVLVIKMGSRKRWWFSKCLWMVTYILCSYILMMCTVIVFCCLMGEKISIRVSPLVMQTLMDSQTQNTSFPLKASAVVLLLPLLITITFSWLQMLLGLIIKPLFAYGVIVAIYVASAYFNKAFLIANYAMPVRSMYFIEQGYSLLEGIFVSVIVSIITFFMGTFMFSHYDILKVTEM